MLDLLCNMLISYLGGVRESAPSPLQMGTGLGLSAEGAVCRKEGNMISDWRENTFCGKSCSGVIMKVYVSSLKQYGKKDYFCWRTSGR